jgi:hypothetical protein
MAGQTQDAFFSGCMSTESLDLQSGATSQAVASLLQPSWNTRQTGNCQRLDSKTTAGGREPSSQCDGHPQRRIDRGGPMPRVSNWVGKDVKW